MTYTVLLVEDEVTQRMMGSRMIEKKLGMRVREAANGKEALFFIGKDDANEIDVVLLDLFMPEMDGFEALQKIREIRPNLPVIVLTGSEKLEDAVRATKLGASDFLSKPIEAERLHVSIQNALKINSLSQEITRLRRKDTNTLTFTDLIGNGGGLAEVIRSAKKAASTDIPILINGETGVGKELFARALHGESNRFGAPFVAVNCAAIPEKLVESTLFGHEKGAFTGAVTSSIGKFREAEGGTLFLDEIGELPLEAQSKLLRALQQKEIEPVGAGREIPVNVRIISATNRNLQAEAEAGRFRDDLLFRLNVFPIEIPPLRKRKQDIAALIDYFLQKFCAAENLPLKNMQAAAKNLLLEQDWLGNVRELENFIFRAIILSESEEIAVDDIGKIVELNKTSKQTNASREIAPWHALNLQTQDGNFKTLEMLETEIIDQLLRHFDGNFAKAADALGVAKSTLYRKLG